MTTIKPDLRAFRRGIDDGACRQALESCRPLHPFHAAFEGIVSDAEAGSPHGCDGRTGIADLVASGQTRPRQVEKTVDILEHQASVLFERGPVLTADHQRSGADFRRHPFDHGDDGLRVGRQHHRRARLDDARFFECDFLDGITEIGLMIERDRRDDRHGRAVNDVGRVEPAAEAHFQQQRIGRALGKQ